MATRTESFSCDTPPSSSPSLSMNTPEAKATKEITQQFLSTKLGRPQKLRLRKEVEILVRLSEDMEAKHEILLNGMFSENRVQLTAQNAHSTYQEISEQIFQTNPDSPVTKKVNWGRIVSLLTFSSKMAAYCEKNDIVTSERVTGWACTALVKHSGWIKKEGRGWDGFVQTYGDPGYEKTLFGGLLAASVGLGALATALYMKS